MEIRVDSFFGVVETASIPVHPARIARTVIGTLTAYSLDGELMVAVDTEDRRIVYAHRSVTVTHAFQGMTQSFQGLATA